MKLIIDHLCVKFYRYIGFWRYSFDFDRWCTLKQLSTSVSVNSDRYLLRHSTARQVSSTINLHFSPIVLFVFVLFMKVRQLYSGKDEASLAFLRVEVTGFM